MNRFLFKSEISSQFVLAYTSPIVLIIARHLIGQVQQTS